MNYILIFIYAFLIAYLFIISHEIIHVIYGKSIKLTPTLIYIMPFTFLKTNGHWHIYNSLYINKSCTSYTCYDSISLTSITAYNKKLNTLRYYFWAGPVFDFTMISILITLGLLYPSTLFYLIAATICLVIATLNFFTIDGKFAIGIKEDPRIAYTLINTLTFRSSSTPNSTTTHILDDMYYNISSKSLQTTFSVHDLWNFLNNITFFTLSLENYLLGNLSSIHENNEKFMDMLLKEFDNISLYDYRQIPKTSKSIITYLIYCKEKKAPLSINENLKSSILKGCNSDYYRNLYKYFIDNDESVLAYLRNPLNAGFVEGISIGLMKFPINILPK